MTKILENIGRNEVGDKTIKPVASTKMWNKFVDDMVWNNTYIPEPTRIIYNVGKKAYPILDANGKRVKDKNGNITYGDPIKILTTIVFFDDGTKVAVTNSEHDGAQFETVKAVPNDPNSPDVVVATEFSKENGFIYATVKRCMGFADAKGTIQGDGFGRRLHNIVTRGYDSALEEAATKYKNKLSKQAYEQARGTAKPKAKRYSIAETLARINEVLDKANDKDTGLISKIMSALKA